MTTKIEHFPATNPNPVLNVGKDGTVLYSNEAGEPLLHGWDVEIGGKLPSNIVNIVQRVISQNSSERMEIKAGKRVFLVAFHPFPEEKCVNIYGFDISDLKEPEEKPHKSERRYHLLFENTLDGITYCRMLYDDCGHPVDFIYLDTNRAFEQLTGLKEVKGKRATELFPGIKESHQELFDIYGRVALTGQPERFEIEFKPLGIWFSISVYSMEREHFVAVFDNITERKKAERALQKSEMKYRFVADNTYDWEFWLDPDGNFLYTSPSCERVTGYAVQEFMDKPDLLREIIHPDDRQAFLQHRHDMPSSPHGDIEFRVVTKDGEIRWIHHRCQSLYDVGGRYAGSRGSNRDITERKRVEETLAFERSQLLSIFDGIDDVVYVTDPYTYKVLYANKAMKEKFGGELVGGLCYREFQRKDSPCDFCTNPIILKEKDKTYHWEYYNPTVDRYFMIMDRIIKWPDGRDVRFEIAKDITERKRVEEALRESEEKFRTLFESASAAIFVADISTGAIIDCNQNAEKLIGSPRREIIGLHQTLLYPADKAQYYRKMFANRLHNTVTKNYEAEVQHSDGRIIPVLINAAPLKINGRNVMIGFFFDITERRKAEEALKKAYDSLEVKVKERTSELEEAYNSLLEKELRLSEAQKIAHLGNWEWNLLNDELYWSDEIYRIFGLDPQELVPTYNEFLSHVDPEDRSYVHYASQKALNGELYDIEYRITLPDGETRIVHSQGEIVYDEKCIPVRMRGILQDITERKKAEEALERIDKIRIKEIHHRIKNNLQVISSLLDLQAEKFEEEKVKEAFREGQNRVISMSLLHEELYKGEGTDTLDFSSYLQKLAENLFKAYSLQSDNIGLSMELEDGAFLDIDIAVPLGIIVNELISNSLKHAFAEDEEGEIRIQLCREEMSDEMQKSIFSLTISDNGKGIPDDLELENAESLGLQLVSILVDQLDGELELKRDKGTEFNIKFNVTEDNNKTSAPARQQLPDSN